MMANDQQERWEPILSLIAGSLAPPISPESIQGRRILITGAGGSIGSALAHAVFRCDPEHVVLLDASEQALHRLTQGMGWPSSPATGTPYTAALGSVGDRGLIEELFERHRPEIVIHTAAFKHVPLMEFHPFAAVQNNALGTFTLTQAAVESGAGQVLMLSTDKAVEPSSIMGASKRIAELILLWLTSGATRLKAVRLGNVLGSDGSVLPIFQSQIDRGEALSVTHPDASRYFLSMQQAVHLLLHALSSDIPAGIFVPELGEPIRIEEIARRLLAASPGSESRIVFTGLHPGDKLTEKLVSPSESVSDLYIGSGASFLRAVHTSSFIEVESAMEELRGAVQERNLPQLLHVVMKLVPDYQPSSVIQAALEEQATMRSQP